MPTFLPLRCASYTPSAVEYRRARTTGVLRSRNSWRSCATGAWTTETLPQGPAPHGARTFAAGQALSSNSGARQSSPGSSSVAFQPSPVVMVRTPSAVVSSRSPRSPAGPATPLVAEIAKVWRPGASCCVTSVREGRRQASAAWSAAAEATSVPSRWAVYPSSAVSTSRARVTPSGTSKAERNQRVAAGALLAGSPSGNQIQGGVVECGCADEGWPGAPTQRADQSAGSVRPVSHQVGADQADTLPSPSQTRTDQW
ncbi:hypothetical protein SMICM304S_05852 [Streptomyces microflavus]